MGKNKLKKILGKNKKIKIIKKSSKMKSNEEKIESEDKTCHNA